MDSIHSDGELTSDWYRQHRIAPHLSSLFYVPDYVVPEQEAALLREVRAAKPKWVQLSGRRLQNLGGIVHGKGLIPAPLPSWLQPLLNRLATEGCDGGVGLYGGKPPNHVLVNSYMPGEGIMPHEDGPAYHPVVAILSLGAPAVLRFRRKSRPEDKDMAAALGAPAAAAAVATDEHRNSGGGPSAADTSVPMGQTERRLPLTPTQQMVTLRPQVVQDQELEQDAAEEEGPASAAAATVTAAPVSALPGSELQAAAPGAATAATAVVVAAAAAVTAAGGSGQDDGGHGRRHDGCRCQDGRCYCHYTASLLLQPRSLVVFRGEAFTDCLHSIDEVSEELLDESVANLDMYGLSPGTMLPRGGERISFTVRRVARVMPPILLRR